MPVYKIWNLNTPEYCQSVIYIQNVNFFIALVTSSIHKNYVI